MPELTIVFALCEPFSNILTVSSIYAGVIDQRIYLLNILEMLIHCVKLEHMVLKCRLCESFCTLEMFRFVLIYLLYFTA